MAKPLSHGFVREIRVEKPSLANNTSDAGRLEQSLKKQLETDYVRMPLHLLKNLPTRLRQSDFRAKVVLFKDPYQWVLLDIINPEDGITPLGIAIDIGTTRIVLNLVNLETGDILGEKGFDNPQAQIGPDVLARIHHSNQPEGLDSLHKLVIDSVNSHIGDLCRDQGFKRQDVFLITGAGNTAMTHLFLGIESYEIIKEPYIPCVNVPNSVEARELGLDINSRGYAFLFPNIGSYFGGDLISGILFARLHEKENPCIMVDVGTNAEIVVGSREWLIACAGAAGPALEGGVSKIGMTAKPGVIERVQIDPEAGSLEIKTIEDQPAIGICGSGMIDLAACLFLTGMIDIRGKFSKPRCKDRLFEKDGIDYFILVDEKNSGTDGPICLNQVDLNSLTSSKAAMYTILEVIVNNTAGLAFEDLAKFYVAGTFGSFIDPRSAISIGMLPEMGLERFEVLGNSSLGGATMLLTDASAFEQILEIRKSITYIELNVNQEFMNMFSGAKFYPHTDRSRFPSVKIMV
ncbi:MAG: ATP-binding protein [Desulfobacteraceae bacterium]|nr:ATP-binding protein [Desulfobacteraceae bacterium]